MTTFTHTISVFALGLVTLFLSQYILPETLLPWLGAISGISIVAVGGSLFYKRLRKLRQTAAPHAHSHSHKHDHAHAEKHDHGHSHDHAHMHANGIAHSHAPKAAHTHDHDHAHMHAHGIAHSHAQAEHKHDHQHEHPHQRDHGHKHDHGHAHAHGLVHDHGDGHMHSHDVPDEISIGGLIALGASGGLVPCPSALVLLLTSIALGRIGLGLLLLTSFSLGLAAVLVGIGLLVLYAKSLLPQSQRVTGHPAFQFVPVLSAAVIVIIGCLMTGVSLGWVRGFAA